MTQVLSLNEGWEFRRIDDRAGSSEWSVVELPHSPFVADLDGREHWFGECEYRRTLPIAPLADAQRFVLFVGAAMHTTAVYVDNRAIARHEGGYLPFEVDLTDALQGQTDHVLTLRLDNRDNPDVPPGKPSDQLDFCWYGGLYRGVELRIRPPLHITESV